MSDRSGSFPPVNPINKPSQIQKSFFPFSAFSSDDPNVTANPKLTLTGFQLNAQTSYVDTAANLASANPVLFKGQIGYETDTKYFKIGDGATAYNSLSYQPQIGKVAPLPQAAAGAGQFYLLSNGLSNTALYLTSNGQSGGSALPGQWLYMAFVTDNGTLFGRPTGGIAAGGTQLKEAVSGWYGYAWVWRLS